ncbi:MAG: M48 family metallopeptidase [Verrucomicrobiales bacterium]|nr:M48 family metallopeptidase [Verrucomicrobiales bacterium]
MKRRWKRWIGVVGCTVVLTGCYTVPETGRQSLNIMSEDEEMKLGFNSFDQMKKEVPISKNAAAKALVEKVGKKIAAVAALPNAQWEFVVFESPEANAFCLPGGKVGVYTGFLPITKDEAGLATVLGHEVAHAVARHGGERISVAKATELVGAAVSVGTSNSKYAGYYQQAYGLTANLGVALPHSRANESEADHIGLIYMARAGYDPEAAVAFWKRFAEYNQKAGGGQTPWFLRTHPLDEDRIKKIQSLIPEARAKAKTGN